MQKNLAELENGKYALAFSSGLAAIYALSTILKAGDHAIISNDVYGGTYRLFERFLCDYKIQATFVDTSNIQNIEKAIQPNTKLIHIESPTNPLLSISDIAEISKLCKSKKLLLSVDNTFMTPYLQRPINLGIDIVIHSATKFIGGHSDVIAGLVVTNYEQLAQKIYSVQNAFGAILAPQDSWLILRGIKTLKVRMDYQQNNAQKLAEFLQKNKNVKEVFYPGLENHIGRQIHYNQANGAGAVLSFKLADEHSVKKFLGKVKMAAVAVSLGGVETIVSYPVKMSHASIPKNERDKQGITDDLLRVSVGLEDIDDLLEDFDRALV